MNTAWHRIAQAAAVILCIGLAACEPQRGGGNGTPGLLRIAGDAPLGALPADLVNAFEAQDRNTTVIYQPMDRAQILAGIHSGEIDAAFVMYPPDDRTIFQTAVGYETLAVVTAADLGINDLSQDALRAIFSGKTASWAEIGGPNLAAEPVLPFDNTSDRAAFEGLIMQHAPISLSALVAGSLAQRVGVIQGKQGRIGVLAGTGIPEGFKAITIGGAAMPTAERARSDYPLIAAIAFIASVEPQGDARQLLDWTIGKDGQRIVANDALPLN